MTQQNSYAHARISFYEARIQSETIPQLVANFNILSASRGWTAERSYYSTALIYELQRRNVNLSAICKYSPSRFIKSICYCPVQYDEEGHSLIPVQ